MRKRILLTTTAILLALAGYFSANRTATVAHAQPPGASAVPKSYGRLVSAVVNHGAVGLIFEDSKGVIRFVTMAGETEKELTRE